MPVEYELGRIINVENVGGFFVSGLIGWDPIFALLKAIAPAQMPASLWRFGATAGYQTPVPQLQVRLSVKRTDEGFDEIGYKETPVSLGLFYQM